MQITYYIYRLEILKLILYAKMALPSEIIARAL